MGEEVSQSDQLALLTSSCSPHCVSRCCVGQQHHGAWKSLLTSLGLCLEKGPGVIQGTLKLLHVVLSVSKEACGIALGASGSGFSAPLGPPPTNFKELQASLKTNHGPTHPPSALVPQGHPAPGSLLQQLFSAMDVQRNVAGLLPSILAILRLLASLFTGEAQHLSPS